MNVACLPADSWLLLFDLLHRLVYKSHYSHVTVAFNIQFNLTPVEKTRSSVFLGNLRTNGKSDRLILRTI